MKIAKKAISLVSAVTLLFGYLLLPVLGAQEQSDGKEYKEVEWSAPKRVGASGGYPRMEKIGNGDLMLFYESGGAIKSARSTNSGKSWTNIGELVYRAEDKAYKPANPTPYYDAQTKTVYLAFRCPIENADGTHTANIRYVKSTDDAKTWSDAYTVASATVPTSSTYGGMWEPTIYRIEGKLLIYYSSDTAKYRTVKVKINVGESGESIDESFPFVRNNKYQNIVVHTLDEESGLWSGAVCAQKGDEHNAYEIISGFYHCRDGMQSISRLSDGSYAMVIETSKHHYGEKYGDTRYPFVIDISFSRDGYEWTKPVTIAKPSEKEYRCAAPWISTLPDGRIVVSYQTDMDLGVRSEGAQLEVIVSKEAVSYSDSESIKTSDFDKFKPLESLNSKVTYNMWNSVFVDGYTAYAIANVSSTNTSVTPAAGMVLSRFDSAPKEEEKVSVDTSPESTAPTDDTSGREAGAKIPVWAIAVGISAIAAVAVGAVAVIKKKKR